jgi:hypothetical protein
LTKKSIDRPKAISALALLAFFFSFVGLKNAGVDFKMRAFAGGKAPAAVIVRP